MSFPAAVHVQHMYYEPMPKMIQIRNVPDGLHRRLKEKAAVAGMSLSDFLKAELERLEHVKTMQEILARPRRSEATIEEILEGIREGRERR